MKSTLCYSAPVIPVLEEVTEMIWHLVNAVSPFQNTFNFEDFLVLSDISLVRMERWIVYLLPDGPQWSCVVVIFSYRTKIAGRQLATSSENEVVSAQFLVTLVISESLFSTPVHSFHCSFILWRCIPYSAWSNIYTSLVFSFLLNWFRSKQFICFCSGESGAGKTVCAKFIMNYLAKVSGGGPSVQVRMLFNIDSFEQKFEECNFVSFSLLFSIENQRCHSRIQSSFRGFWQCQDCQEQQLQSICKCSLSNHAPDNYYCQQPVTV